MSRPLANDPGDAAKAASPVPVPSMSISPAAALVRSPSLLLKRFFAVWWFVLPALVFYVAATLLPAIQGAAEAFTDWDGLSPTIRWVGFGNFAAMRNDPAVVDAVTHTLIIAASLTIVQNVFGLLLALGVNSHIKTARILSAIFFAPAIVTPIVVAFLWQYLYAPFGVLSSAFTSIGLESPDWLGNSDIALWSIIAVIVWQYSGYSMVIFLAGLQGIPPEVLEAAEIDGAGPVRKLWSVQLPLLAPAVLVNVLLTIVHGLKLFDVVWVMTQGGPGTATQTLSTLIFQNAFAFNKVGYSNAIALVLTIIALPVAIVQFRAVGVGRSGR